jgi:acyl-CoA thioesterase-1
MSTPRFVPRQSPRWLALPALLVLCLVSLGPSAAGANAARPLVYAAIGASESVGVGANHPATESWVADLARKLPPGSRLINLGKSGALLAYGLSMELPAVLASHPDVVTVWMAVNDLNARVPPAVYRQQLTTLLQALRQHSHATVYVGNVPYLPAMPLYGSLDATALLAVIGAYNRDIAAVTRDQRARLVDIYRQSRAVLPRHPEFLSGDGFHPSTAGYANLADFWWNVICLPSHVCPPQ